MAAFRTGLTRLASGLVASAWCLTVPHALAAQTDAAAMDQLLGPIALYPDPLLAQVLTCATSPEQVTKFHTWLDQQTLTGSELQKAAMDAGFEASFASLAVFPQVVSTLSGNVDWTKELGTAYLSDAAGVTASVQRLRAKAQAAGTLKTNPQQTVTVENQGGNQTVIIQPTNPQVVYVPQYDPQVVYAPPPPSSSGDAAVAALIGFGVGVAIAAAIDNDPPWGWSAWGMGWHGGGIYYRRSVWVVPVRPRYPYVRPVPVYHPSRTVIAPRRTNVTVNVNNNTVNVGNRVNVGNKVDIDNRNTNVGDRTTNVGNRTTNVAKGSVSDRTPNAGNRTANVGGTQQLGTANRGHATSNAGTARKPTAGASAMGGYGNGSQTRAASSRGKSSVGASSRRGGAGGGRRR